MPGATMRYFFGGMFRKIVLPMEAINAGVKKKVL